MPANGLKDGGFGAETVPRPLVSVRKTGRLTTFRLIFGFIASYNPGSRCNIVVVACGILTGSA
jgi:hypothetical protein